MLAAVIPLVSVVKMYGPVLKVSPAIGLFVLVALPASLSMSTAHSPHYGRRPSQCGLLCDAFFLELLETLGVNESLQRIVGVAWIAKFDQNH